MKFFIVLVFINLFSFQAVSSDKPHKPESDKPKKKTFRITLAKQRTEKDRFGKQTGKKPRFLLPRTRTTCFTPVVPATPVGPVCITPPIFDDQKLEEIRFSSLNNQFDSLCRLLTSLPKSIDDPYYNSKAEQIVDEIIDTIKINPSILDTTHINRQAVVPWRTQIENMIEHEKVNSPISVDDIFSLEIDFELSCDDGWIYKGSALLKHLEAIKDATF